MSDNTTIPEFFLEANRICKRCRSIIPIGIFCKKPLVTGGWSVYHYCAQCNISVGAKAIPKEFSKPYITSVEFLPQVANATNPHLVTPRKKTKGWITSVENRTCPTCDQVVPIGIICALPDSSVVGGEGFYYYCENCDRAVGLRFPRGHAFKYDSIVNKPNYNKKQKKQRIVPLFPNKDGKITETIRKKINDLKLLRTMPYSEYLLTEHWLKVREQALRRARHRCQLCNGKDRLQVHHRTYERRGCEEPEDLTVLCRPCHEKFHNILAQKEEE